MRFGVRTRLLVTSLLITLFAGACSAIYVEFGLVAALETHLEAQVVEHAHSVRETLRLYMSQHPSSSLSPEKLDDLIRRLGKATRVRISVLSADGTFVADSDFLIDPHQKYARHQPEVKEALEKGIGIDRRRSTSSRERTIYVALPYEGDVIRASTSISSLSGVVTGLRILLLAAVLVGLGVSALLSIFASRMFAEAFEGLIALVRDLTEGKSYQLALAPVGPIEQLAQSFTQLTRNLDDATATLALERSQFEAILNSMTEGVLVMSQDQRILLINPETLNLLDLKAPPVGQPLSDVIDLNDLIELAEQGTQRRSETEFAVPAGSKTRTILARATPLLEGRGTVVVMHDVTEIRRLENIRKDFVANVSHELRTPVSIVQANAETLLDGALNDPVRARTFVEALHRNAERLSRIIADLLDLSRLEAGRYRFEMMHVDVADPVNHAVDAVERRAQQRSQAIDVSVPRNLSVRADSKVLEQVLLNLLENSIKYTPNGGHVAVRAEERPGEIRLEVQDDGPGIRDEHRARVFERFYRIDPGRSRDMGGTGLGLAIVKHFVESMGGRVGVDPAFPRGSIFWVTLPLETEDFVED